MIAELLFLWTVQWIIILHNIYVELTLKEDPYIGEIVLAPNPGFNNEYQRAFIEKINYVIPNAWNLGETTKESNAMVYFFDSGGLHRVKLIKMKPVTKPIMKVNSRILLITQLCYRYMK